MLKKSLKVMFYIFLLFIIVICGDDETRDALKRKWNNFKEKRTANKGSKVTNYSQDDD